MNESNIELAKDGSIFEIMDNEDNKLISAADSYMDAELPLVYEVLGKHSLSVIGARNLTIWMADFKLHKDNAMPLRVMGSSFESDGLDKNKKWYSTVLVENKKTGVIFEGHGQCSQFLKRKDGSLRYDDHARTKAHSKAERNGILKHIPDIMKHSYIKYAKEKNKIKVLNVISSETNYEGQAEAPAQTSSKEKIDFCLCKTPAPKFDKNHTCAVCNKPVNPKNCAICLGKR